MFTRHDKVTDKHACTVTSLFVGADDQSAFIFCRDADKSDAV